MLSNRERLILLNLVPDVGSLRLRRLLDAFGTLERLWQASASEFQQVAGIGPLIAQRLWSACRDEPHLEQEVTLAKRHGVTIVTLEDPAYPPALRTIPDPPLALYVQGCLGAPSEANTPDEAAVAIVGSRYASRYGLQCAERLAYDLALRGVTVVSGLARGIDGVAHRGALKAQGRTLAVLGCGLSRVYPPEHATLAQEIIQRGALLSEYPMGMAPLAQHFPRRNRLISGLALGVVVVEASQRSGALITADMALEQGREVFAVPGPMTSVTSAGTHQLLKQGARLVTSVEDIVEELHLSASPASPVLAFAGKQGGAGAQPMSGTGRAAGDAEAAGLPASWHRVLACVSEGQPRDIEAIVTESGLPMPEVLSLLLQLELKRRVQQLPGKRFVKRWS